MHLTDRHPMLDAAALVPRFMPPHRFEDVRFDTYKPNDAYPSQAAARDELQKFAAATAAGPKRSFFSRKPKNTGKAARYLDGGFGVGKTHLLASLWHAAEGPKGYLTFNDLTAFIGFTGMHGAVEAFAGYRLLCIDEFELDDVANTLMVVSFLRGAMDNTDMRLAVTSNTLPDQLGERRFSASEFRREIAAISAYFDEMRIDGPDFRTTSAPLPLAQLTVEDEALITTDDFEAVLEHLRRIHPVHYSAMLDDLHGVRINGMRQITDQDEALLFVAFVDKLYDARIPVSITGCPINEVFSPSFRNGGYRKKYGRAESRMTAMQGESAGLI